MDSTPKRGSDLSADELLAEAKDHLGRWASSYERDGFRVIGVDIELDRAGEHVVLVEVDDLRLRRKYIFDWDPKGGQYDFSRGLCIDLMEAVDLYYRMPRGRHAVDHPGASEPDET